MHGDEVGSVAVENHASVAWDNIPDAHGNEWAFFDADLNASQRWAVEAPRFYIFDNVGPFSMSTTTSGYSAGANGDTNGEVIVTVSFTHPLNLTANATAGSFYDLIETVDTNLTSPDPITDLTYNTITSNGAGILNKLFQIDLDGDGAGSPEIFATAGADIATIGGSLEISSDHTSLKLTINAVPTATGLLGGIVHGTSTITFVPQVTSAINGTVTSPDVTVGWTNTL